VIFTRTFVAIIIVIVSSLGLPLGASANVVGVDSQNFNPTSNGLDFVTVQSSETLKPGIFNLGLFLNYAVNTLPNYVDVTTQSLTSPKDQLLSMDFSIGLGLLKDWDIGLTIPQVLSQSVDANSTTFQGFFENTGVTEIRANTKYRLFGDALKGLAVVGSANFFLIENYPYTGSDPGPTFNLQLAGDYTFGKIGVGINIGYRFRNPGEPIAGIPVQPTGDQFLFSAAANYLIPSIDTKLIAEVYSSFPTEDIQFVNDRDVSTAEFLAGLKWDASRSVAVHFGAGSELFHGSASPDFRIYSGINWAFGPLFGKTYESEDLAVYQRTTYKVPQKKRRKVYIDEVDFQRAAVPEETIIAKDVLFDFDSARIKPGFYPLLKQFAAYLERGGGFRLLKIDGHTDSVGSAAYNMTLSQKRALAVQKALRTYLKTENHGKVSAFGKGESEPIADNGNYQGRAQNRRVEFKIYR